MIVHIIRQSDKLFICVIFLWYIFIVARAIAATGLPTFSIFNTTYVTFTITRVVQYGAIRCDCINKRQLDHLILNKQWIYVVWGNDNG